MALASPRWLKALVGRERERMYSSQLLLRFVEIYEHSPRCDDRVAKKKKNFINSPPGLIVPIFRLFYRRAAFGMSKFFLIRKVRRGGLTRFELWQFARREWKGKVVIVKRRLFTCNRNRNSWLLYIFFILKIEFAMYYRYKRQRKNTALLSRDDLYLKQTRIATIFLRGVSGIHSPSVKSAHVLSRRITNAVI